jgi:hypothetical protein
MNANDLAVCLISNLRWFTFSQNNSGGRFAVDDKVDAYVIIQAPDADTANQLAERIGIYFNGVFDGYDCECCGDRWSSLFSYDDGTDTPQIYGQEVPYSPDAVMTSDRQGDIWDNWSARGVKVYPYSVISKM